MKKWIFISHALTECSHCVLKISVSFEGSTKLKFYAKQRNVAKIILKLNCRE
jgi:hypothetical protein